MTWDQITALSERLPSGVIVPIAIAITAAVSFLLLVRLARRKSPKVVAVEAGSGHAVAVEAGATLRQAGPLAVLGACGMIVSLWGLYGFARDTADLPMILAVPFMAIFDMAEVTCFVSLYRSAARSKRWTAPMRSTRRTAWGLVFASAAMNWSHAPDNWIARAVLAAVPMISAKLIEHELDKLLADNAEDEDEGTRPGPVRLIVLLYLHTWAKIFARLGLNAAGRDGQISRTALINRAAIQVNKLGKLLDTEAAQVKNGGSGRARWRFKSAAEKQEERAKRAVDAAGLAGDTPAQLLLAQGLATRGRVKDLARMPVDQPLKIMSLLEELAIMPSAEAIKAGARAAEAEKRRQEAEEAAERASEVQREAEEAAEAARRQAADERAGVESAQREAEEAAERQRQTAERASEAQREAEEAAEAARRRREQLDEEITRLRQKAEQLTASTTATDQKQQEAAAALDKLHDQTRDLATQRDRLEDAAAAHQASASQARAALQEAEEEARRQRESAERMREETARLHREARKMADQRAAQEQELDALAREQEEAQDRARTAQRQAEEAIEEARWAEGIRKAATVALSRAPEALMDALTNPNPYEAPRWTSEAKRRGWDFYVQTVETSGEEPTDEELAKVGERDPSTARKWLSEFRPVNAERVAAALPAQQDAHTRTEDSAPVPAGV